MFVMSLRWKTGAGLEGTNPDYDGDYGQYGPVRPRNVELWIRKRQVSLTLSEGIVSPGRPIIAVGTGPSPPVTVCLVRAHVCHSTTPVTTSHHSAVSPYRQSSRRHFIIEQSSLLGVLLKKKHICTFIIRLPCDIHTDPSVPQVL